ncbi:MAG: FAD-dependent oxidoreductase [Nitrosopumilaceae archaeon]|jgi:protoporphyrinogen oxidase|uniref:FAD-dependent oxidoreductase n=3 Tax=Candidatus Nitrosomaritimum aestuariumsis TaxID=3342354 RepID=A0AC60W7K1_9ARCH|nr:FAD-dependent oxidoreductase [Nitrosopumilaceae archaeon]MBA4453595.1 FAD-dependent oxidoreductase [Nitrosopumilaceae archaeon]MBA4459756.1 FAD-dependent oxidoreductase [Nitrosopumilaceae archaeon]MBA4461978.1 FAD-dependent oxidoreductase [Nitrosopumilaceae archaeon]MBA4462993.1 FAD-dependent oxidoreductase [Nitrosopumilaceae archaeon]
MDNQVIIIGAGVGGLSLSALLSHEGIQSKIFEKSQKIGGRTASMIYKNHILDNGFHIMPFYTQSAIYKIFKKIGIESSLKLSKVDEIAFFAADGFHRYPKGISDLLRLSMIPFKSRLSLLKILLPMAFTSIEKTESWDNIPLTESTKNLDNKSNAFFEAVCMLAFADSAKNISLGEFARTIIRANPFKGGTSEFAYPQKGGYDEISRVLRNYIERNGGSVNLQSPIKKIIVQNKQVVGIIDSKENFIETNCVVISYPAYHAINQLFDKDVFDEKFVNKINKLNETTAVVEVHFALSKKLDNRQVVFPVGDKYVSKGIFFISNMTPNVSPKGEHLIISGTPVPPNYVKDPSKIREIVDQMKNEINDIYPEFQQSLLWERPMAWSLVESVVKKPGMVWKSKMPHSVKDVSGLFFVGDSTVSYGIGTDSAAHSSILCLPKILEYLKTSKPTMASIP